MKKSQTVIVMTAFISSITFAQSSLESSLGQRQGQQIYFNPRNIGQCVTVTTRSQAKALFSEGWLPSANGKCAPKSTSLFCGMGGVLLMHPSVESLRYTTSDSCETDQFTFMGWVHAK